MCFSLCFWVAHIWLIKLIFLSFFSTFKTFVAIHNLNVIVLLLTPDLELDSSLLLVSFSVVVSSASFSVDGIEGLFFEMPAAKDDTLNS